VILGSNRDAVRVETRYLFMIISMYILTFKTSTGPDTKGMWYNYYSTSQWWLIVPQTKDW